MVLHVKQRQPVRHTLAAPGPQRPVRSHLARVARQEIRPDRSGLLEGHTLLDDGDEIELQLHSPIVRLG